jgi:hypothetical protein
MHGEVLAAISALNVSLLPLGPSCPQQTILPSDLVGCGSPLQKVMGVWHTFLKFEGQQTAIIVCRGLLHPTQYVKIFKKVYQMAIFIFSGLLYPTGWEAAQPSEEISRRFFFQWQRNPLRI